MRRLHDVPVRALDPGRFASVLAPDEFAALAELLDRGARELRGRAVWNVNSTAASGGVAELLRPLLGYARGGGVDARWVVISGPAEFFALTKRVHNQLLTLRVCLGGPSFRPDRRDPAVDRRVLAQERGADTQQSPNILARAGLLAHEGLIMASMSACATHESISAGRSTPPPRARGRRSISSRRSAAAC